VKTPTQVGPLERANLNHWTSKSKNPVILSVIYSSEPFTIYLSVLFMKYVFLHISMLAKMLAPSSSDAQISRKGQYVVYEFDTQT
jgi:hypothetical protein